MNYTSTYSIEGSNPMHNKAQTPINKPSLFGRFRKGLNDANQAIKTELFQPGFEAFEEAGKELQPNQKEMSLDNSSDLQQYNSNALPNNLKLAEIPIGPSKDHPGLNTIGGKKKSKKSKRKSKKSKRKSKKSKRKSKRRY